MKGLFKKTGAIFLASAILAGSTAFILPEVVQNGIVAQAANSERDFYTKENDDGTITITGYKGTSANVIIPSKIFGEKVTRIEDMGDGKSFITSVTVPDTVTYVYFRDCKKLKKVNLPNSITVIPINWYWGAFEGCESLESITIPNSVTSIESGAFRGCTSLKSVTFSNKLTKLDSEAFSGCTSLKSVTIPNSVTEVRDGVFDGCTSLTSAKLSSRMKNIPEGMFHNCTSLKNVEIPEGITAINGSWWRGVFQGCESLESINIPDSVNEIGGYAFSGCHSLKSLTIPSKVTKIDYAFAANCGELEKVIIPESVTEIDNTAFDGSNSVTIYGKKNSTADKYANNHDIPFVAIVSTSGVTLNTSGIALNKGETYNLKATVHPTNATVKDVTWTTSNSKVATVKDGKVTAKSSGVAKITARTYEGKTATCSVTVYGDATSVRLNRSSVKLEKGKSTLLSATVLPAYAKDKTVTWTSSNTKVATVSRGTVKAVGAGTATITAKTVNGKKATCKVTVEINPTKVKLSRTSVSLNKGKTTTIKATITPSNATNKKVTWTTSNKKVAVVSNGKITAKGVGTATITVKTANGKKATCKVTVKSSTTVNPTKVKLSKTSVTLGKGKSTTLKATVSPSNATNKKVTWTTSNKKVATVSNGKITAKGTGTATITVKTANGKKATCKVTVKNLPTRVKLNRTSATLKKGKTLTLKATVTPSKNVISTVSWTSSNNKVATVKNGKVTAKAKGTATITVKTTNGKTARCKITVK